MKAAWLVGALMLGACGGPGGDDAGADAGDDAGSLDVDAGHDAGPPECPEMCPGDTRCDEASGWCAARPEGELDPGCAMNLAIYVGQCSSFDFTLPYVSARVCNRGTEVVGPDQLVRFESDGVTFCETMTTAPLDPGACVTTECTPYEGFWEDVVVDPWATVNPDGASLECDALDNTMTALISHCA